jgi:hypothetical protein
MIDEYAKAELRELIYVIIDVTEWHGDYADAVCPLGHEDARLFLSGMPYLHCVHDRCESEVAALNAQLREAVKGAVDPEVWKAVFKPDKKEMARRKRLRAVRAAAKVKLLPLLLPHPVPLEYWMEKSPVKLEGDPKNDWRLLLPGLYQPDDFIWCGELYESGPDYKHNFHYVRDWLKRKHCPGSQVCVAPFDADKRMLQDHLDMRRIPQDEDTGEYDLRGVRDFYRPKGANHFVGFYWDAGEYRRASEFIKGMKPYFVLESDTLSYEQFGAVVAYFMRQYKLRAIVDTGGKSLHAWFDAPAYPEQRIHCPEQVMSGTADDHIAWRKLHQRELDLEDLRRKRYHQTLKELPYIAKGLSCDPKMFRPCPTARLPGCLRRDEDGQTIDRWQQLIYLNPKF